MSEDYLALAGRIRLELSELDKVAERALTIWANFGASSEDYLVDAAALNLQGFYAGLEKLFESIASRIDRSELTGPNWHQELLRQMAVEVPGVRPPAISIGLLEALDRYRGFRHVVRNVYTYQLDKRQIAPLIEDLEGLCARLRDELLAFAKQLEEIAHAGPC